MNKAIGKRIVASLLALAFMITTSVTVMFTSAQTYDLQAGVTTNSVLLDQDIDFDTETPENNYVTMNYTVDFTPIEKAAIPLEGKDKEIVIVIDTSGSMSRDVDGNYNDDSRLSIVKTAANNFLTDLNTNSSSNIKVALVEYNTKAYPYDENNELKDLSSNISSLKGTINGYSAGGYTNIGDGLRRANYILQNGSSEADKYVVMLTDGQPSAISVTSLNKSYGSSSNNIGTFYKKSGDTIKYLDSVNSASYLYDAGSPEKYALFKDGNYKGFALEYSQLMAGELLADIPEINSYYIAFSNLTAQNKLQAISTYSNGLYYPADTAADIDTVYSAIATEITADVKLENMTYSEPIPNGVEVISTTNDVEFEDGVLSKEIGTVSYNLNEAGTHYEADSFDFSVVVAPSQAGTYTFGGNYSSILRYTDIDGNPGYTVFPSRVLTANDGVDPNLQPDKVLDVLEVQPGLVFELTKSQLEDKFPGLTVNLRQMAMTELIGNVEAINGQYDIVYIGAIEDYDDYRVYGKGDNYVETDIDITNRKAKDVLEFANSGQLLILDNELLSMYGTKIQSNMDTIKNLDNVHLVDYIAGSAINSIVSWYDASTQRPRLSVTSEPKAYDGTKASYESSHLMSYLYTGFNEYDHTMETYLSIDLNGDGIFSDNEQVLKKDVNISMSGLSLNYSLDNSFNGLMPWKLELVDTVTKASDYLTGFSAYEGDKTIVNVLQLSPGEDRMNIDSSTFVKPLATEDYEINITYMQIADFNEAYENWDPAEEEYPASIGDMPTVLNGNYDMIIFGFGDSFAGKVDGTHSNKDLTNEAAIDAIDEFISTGQSILFTHDTAGPQDYTNNTDMRTSTQSYNDYVSYNDAPNMTANFKDDMGFSNTRTYAGMKMWRAWNSVDAYKLNEGLITMYPYVLADNAAKTLSIASTHDQYWEIDLEGENVVPWFTLDAGNFKYLPAAYYYTFTNGNITYSGTGHSTPNGVEEQEFFVNTMLKASRGANHPPTLDVVDLYDGMNVVPSQDQVDFKMTIHDIDLQDDVFTAEVYTVFNDLEVKVKTMSNVSKDELLEVTFTKPASLTEDITEFVVKVVAEDEHGAQGVKEYNATHKEVPTLDVTDDSKNGYLLGDTISINYEVSTVREADKDVIENISLRNNINSGMLDVTSWTGWTQSGNLYYITPEFDNPDTTADETNTSFNLEMEAIVKGTSTLQMTGTYDVVFNDVAEGDTMLGVSFEKDTPINIEEGVITAEVKDNLGRAVAGASISIKDDSGTIVSYGSTNATGIYTGNAIKSGTYTVGILSLPASYAELSLTSEVVTLSYSNPTVFVDFTAKDNQAPEIETEFSEDINITNGAEFNLPVHVKVDGVKSKIVAYYYKKLDDGVTTSNSADFEGTNAGTNVAFEDYDLSNADPVFQTSPIAADPLSPEGFEAFGYFEVTENGDYAIYALNEAGNVTVEVIKIKSIIIELPDSI